MSAILAACGGFLLAVLWMDLMFDVQVLRYRSRTDPLPEDILASIAGYYRRVTTEARPMNVLIAAVMLLTILGCIIQLILGRDPRWAAGASLALSSVPILLARIRIIGNAVRLGARQDDPAGQSDLARGICRDHLACLGAIALFIGLQLSMAFR